MISDYFNLALKNLRRRKLRSWLTMLGIFVSIAIIFVLISLSLGLELALQEQFDIIGANQFFVYPSLAAGMPGASNPVSMTVDDFDVVSSVNGVKAATYMSIENARLEFSNQVRYLMIIGFPLERGSEKLTMEEVYNLDMDEGSFLSSGDTGKVLLGSEFKYGKVFSKPLKTGDRIEINGYSFKVRGILSSIGNPADDKQLYIGIEDMKEVFNTSNRADTMVIQVQDGSDINEVASRVEKKLRAFRGVTRKTQDFSVVTPEELMRTIKGVLNIVTAFLLAVASISLVVGGVGIANTMYTSVLERYNEIGVMKAIGARNMDVLKLFVIESGLLGLVGGIIGVILGILMSKTIEYISVVQLHTTLLQAPAPIYLIFGCLVFAFFVGAIAGTFPAWRASQIRPVEALRYE